MLEFFYLKFGDKIVGHFLAYVCPVLGRLAARILLEKVDI